jgi:hypothetical protein
LSTNASEDHVMTTDASDVSCANERTHTDHPCRALVLIAAVVCTFVFLIVIMIGVFASDQMIIAAYIAVALGAMGVRAGARA